LNECADGGDLIPDLPTPSGLISIDSAGHPENAGDMLRIKGQMESDGEEPKMPESYFLSSIRPKAFGYQ
jgi:hypothetical protein